MIFIALFYEWEDVEKLETNLNKRIRHQLQAGPRRFSPRKQLGKLALHSEGIKRLPLQLNNSDLPATLRRMLEKLDGFNDGSVPLTSQLGKQIQQNNRYVFKFKKAVKSPDRDILGFTPPPDTVLQVVQDSDEC